MRHRVSEARFQTEVQSRQSSGCLVTGRTLPLMTTMFTPAGQKEAFTACRIRWSVTCGIGDLPLARADCCGQVLLRRGLFQLSRYWLNRGGVAG